MTKWKDAAQRLKQSVHVLSLAARHPRTPWYAKVLALAVAAYALSPIDLIPDPIPVLGYLDDLVLLPVGIWLTLKLIPPDVRAECHARAASATSERRVSRAAAVVIVALWLVAAYIVAGWLWRFARAGRA